MIDFRYESVAVSSRIRLARNFADYPFPGRLMGDRHAEEQAWEIVRYVSAQLNDLDVFLFHDIKNLSDERAEYFIERNLMSRDLIRHRGISAALIHRDESISVMINEEDHIREQYFMKGFDLRRAYERISGIDDVISETIPFAYDKTLGYLTACPSNLGTGLRASVMLFLPALFRRGKMPAVEEELKRSGLTVRGALGEGSGAEGQLFQISNEVTLGYSEDEILKSVEEKVSALVGTELKERERMKAVEGIALKDRVMRAFGILSNCCTISESEFTALMADLKLGVAIGYFGDSTEEDDRIGELDELIVEMRPANINLLHGGAVSTEQQNLYRAGFINKKIKKILE